MGKTSLTFVALQINEIQARKSSDEKNLLDFAGFMICGACSKTCATIVSYPHGR